MEFLIPIVILVASAILHEIMHGVVADRLGDHTARIMGRLTLNPIPHLDPIMSILLPTLLVLSGSPIIFGAAKPVPVNPIHFRDPKKDMALTALSGPLTNIALALVASQILRFLPLNPLIYTVLSSIVIYNLMLAIINLIPIPPLDGSKVLYALLPSSMWKVKQTLEQYGFFILIIFIFFFFQLISPVIQYLYLFFTGGIGYF